MRKYLTLHSMHATPFYNKGLFSTRTYYSITNISHKFSYAYAIYNSVCLHLSLVNKNYDAHLIKTFSQHLILQVEYIQCFTVNMSGCSMYHNIWYIQEVICVIVVCELTQPNYILYITDDHMYHYCFSIVFVIPISQIIIIVWMND